MQLTQIYRLYIIWDFLVDIRQEIYLIQMQQFLDLEQLLVVMEQ